MNQQRQHPTPYLSALFTGKTVEIQKILQAERLHQWCERASLLNAYDYVRLNNTGETNSYHNTEHCFGVARICLDLGEINGLDENEMAGTVLGALFHDFDHTASNVPDAENIRHAIAGLNAYRATLPEPRGIGWANFDLVFQLAEDCIRVTEFPFVHEPRAMTEQVIRDADLLYASSSLDVLEVMEGLREEMEFKTSTVIPMRLFAERNRQFLDNAKFFTPAADAMFRAIRKPVTDLIDGYVERSEA